jgi:hypothetical protein
MGLLHKNDTFKLKITLDRHSPRLKLNDGLLPDPSNFSLPTTFHQRLVLGTDDLVAERGNDLLLMEAERRLAVADARGEALGEGGGALQRRRIAVQVDQRHAGDLPYCVPKHRR